MKPKPFTEAELKTFPGCPRKFKLGVSGLKHKEKKMEPLKVPLSAAAHPPKGEQKVKITKHHEMTDSSVLVRTAQQLNITYRELSMLLGLGAYSVTSMVTKKRCKKVYELACKGLVGHKGDKKTIIISCEQSQLTVILALTKAMNIKTMELDL